ncbi:unnamed protein product [Caenorhabditis nigoni]
MVRANGSMTTQERDDGKFEINDGSRIFTLSVKETGCDCSAKNNVHCRFCSVCPYRLACNCPEKVPGVACLHMHELQNVLLMKGCTEDEDEQMGEDDTEVVGEEETVSFDVNSLDKDAPIVDAKNVQLDDIGSEETILVNSVLEVEQVAQGGLDMEYEMHEDPVEDARHMRMERINSIENNLDYLQNLSHAISKKKTGDADLASLEDMIKQFSIKVMQTFPTDSEAMPIRRVIANNPKARDETQREKYTLNKRQEYKAITDIDDDDVAFCGICKKTDPPGDDHDIEWLGCLSCKIWVHSICALDNNNLCYICRKEYSETETLKEGRSE